MSSQSQTGTDNDHLASAIREEGQPEITSICPMNTTMSPAEAVRIVTGTAERPVERAVGIEPDE